MAFRSFCIRYRDFTQDRRSNIALIDVSARASIYCGHSRGRDRRRGEEACIAGHSNRGETWDFLGGPDPAILLPPSPFDDLGQLAILLYPHPGLYRLLGLALLLHDHSEQS